MSRNTRLQGSRGSSLEAGYHSKRVSLPCKKRVWKKGEDAEREADLQLQFFLVEWEAESFSEWEGGSGSLQREVEVCNRYSGEWQRRPFLCGMVRWDWELSGDGKSKPCRTSLPGPIIFLPQTEWSRNGNTGPLAWSRMGLLLKGCGPSKRRQNSCEKCWGNDWDNSSWSWKGGPENKGSWKMWECGGVKELKIFIWLNWR